MRRYLIAVLAVWGLAQAQDSTSSVKVLYEDTTVKFWHAGATKRTIGPSCDKTIAAIKTGKKYTYGTYDLAGSCYSVIIISAADRKKETDWLANSLVMYTKRSSRIVTIGKQKYTVEEWTEYGEDGGLILAFETTDNQLLRIVAIPVTKY